MTRNTKFDSLIQRPLLRLLETQNPDGGWGPEHVRPSTTEATSLAVLALRSPAAGGPGSAAREQALEWLRSRQRPDGAWPHSNRVTNSSWMTPLAVIALAHFPADRARALAGARYVLRQKGRGYSWLTRLFFRLFPERNVIELNPELHGWPWVPDTFSWVEPTAYALLALKKLGPALPHPETYRRIDEGERMLYDRTCRQGGWNYGNSRVLEEDLWPYPDTTALALMALQDATRRREIQRGLEALNRMLKETDSDLALALSILCFQIYGRDTAPLLLRLADRMERVLQFGETRTVALSALALDEDPSPFSVPG